MTVNKQAGGDPAVTKLLTAIKAGSGAPDLMQAEYQKLPTLVSANALADISKNIEPPCKSEFPASVWNSVTLGLRRGLRGPAGLRADDVLLPRRHLRASTA